MSKHNYKLNKVEMMHREFRLLARAIRRTKYDPKEKYQGIVSVQTEKGKIVETGKHLPKEWR